MKTRKIQPPSKYRTFPSHNEPTPSNSFHTTAAKRRRAWCTHPSGRCESRAWASSLPAWRQRWTRQYKNKPALRDKPKHSRRSRDATRHWSWTWMKCLWIKYNKSLRRLWEWSRHTRASWTNISRSIPSGTRPTSRSSLWTSWINWLTQNLQPAFKKLTSASSPQRNLSASTWSTSYSVHKVSRTNRISKALSIACQDFAFFWASCKTSRLMNRRIELQRTLSHSSTPS